MMNPIRPTLYVQFCPSQLGCGIPIASCHVYGESFLTVLGSMLRLLKPGTSITVYLDEPYTVWHYTTSGTEIEHE